MRLLMIGVECWVGPLALRSVRRGGRLALGKDLCCKCEESSAAVGLDKDKRGEEDLKVTDRSEPCLAVTFLLPTLSRSKTPDMLVGDLALGMREIPGSSVDKGVSLVDFEVLGGDLSLARTGADN